MSEGSAIELYLLAHGAESEEVHAEKRSKNTYENFLYSKEIIDELKEERRRQKQNKQLFGNCYDTGNNFIVRNIDGKPYTNLNAINRVVNRLCKNAGLKHCTIHGFRHTVASLLDDNGVPIQEISVLLGHENVATTEKIYIHRNRTAKRENISLLENVIGYVRQDVRQTQI